MDILVLDGALRPHPNEDRAWIVEIPLVFTHLSTGPKSILQFTIESRTPGLRLFGEQTLHPYAPTGLSVASDLTIMARPVNFIEEEGGANRLVFVSAARLAPGHESLPETIKLGIKMTLSTNGFVRIPIRASVDEDGRLQVELESRSPVKRALPLVNLCLIGLGVVVLFSLVLPGVDKLHPVPESKPIYLQNKAVLQTGLGVLLSFLGLSIGRLRSIFSFVGNPIGLFRWPELHFEPGMLRLFRSRVMTALLSLMFVAELLLACEVCWKMPEWPPSAKIKMGAETLDGDGKPIHLLGSQRSKAKVVCGDEHMALGNLGFRKIQWKTFEVVDSRQRGSKSSTMVLGREILDACAPSEKKRDLRCKVRDYLCEGKGHARIEGYKVTLLPFEEFSRNELDRLVRQFKGLHFKGEEKDKETIFHESGFLADEFAAALTAAVEDRSLSRRVVVDLLEVLLQDMRTVREKVIVERAVLVQGVLRFLESKPGVAWIEPEFPEEAGATIAETFDEAVSSVFRSSTEFAAVAELAVALSLSDLGRGTVEALHRTILSKIEVQRQGSSMERVGILRYARAFVLMGGAGLSGMPQLCYFRSAAKDLQMWTPEFRSLLRDIHNADLKGPVRDLLPREQDRLSGGEDAVWSRCKEDV